MSFGDDFQKGKKLAKKISAKSHFLFAVLFAMHTPECQKNIEERVNTVKILNNL